MSHRFIELVVRARRLVGRGSPGSSPNGRRTRLTSRRQLGDELTQFSFRLALVIDLAYVGIGAIGGAAVTASARTPDLARATADCTASSPSRSLPSTMPTIPSPRYGTPRRSDARLDESGRIVRGNHRSDSTCTVDLRCCTYRCHGGNGLATRLLPLRLDPLGNEVSAFPTHSGATPWVPGIDPRRLAPRSDSPGSAISPPPLIRDLHEEPVPLPLEV